MQIIDLFRQQLLIRDKIEMRIKRVLDRGKYIRSKSHYAELLNFFETFIIDDFYKFSYKYIFHYRNFNLKEFYYQWKNENK